MLRWKSSLKPTAAAPSGGNPGTSNLVAWLGMEEGSGTSVADSTSNNNDFTLTNGSWVTGKVGSYAVRLDGNGDYMDSDANFAVGANVCTVSFWMYWTDAGSDEKFIYELGNRWWQNDGSIAFSWVQNESVFKASMHDGSGNLEVKFPEPSSGQWVYVTVVHNGPGGSSNAGEIKLYYDGTAQSYSSYSSTKDQASNIGQAGSLFYIGANSANSQEITIDVDTFAVFSDELTQDEITWMYNSGNGRSYSDVSGAASLSTPTLLGKRDPTSTEQTTTQIDISSATQGALMIASITVRSTQGNLSGPSESGWKLLASVDNGDVTNRPLNRAYYKVAGASESNVTWTHDSDYTSAVAIEIVGADETSIYDLATNGVDLTSEDKDILLSVNVPNNGLVIAIHAKGDDADTSSSTVRDSDDNDQTQYTMLGDAYGATRSGTAIAWGDVGSGDTNGTDKIVGSGSGSRTATHHIAISVPFTGTLIAFEDSAYNDGHSGYSSPRNMTANYPAVSANDIMLMFVVTDSTNTGDLGTETGWTKVVENDYRNTIGVYWKLADSNAEATSETWDNMFGSNETYYVWVGAYSGCNTSSPIDVSTSSTQTNNSTTWSTSISPTTNNTMVVSCFAHDKSNAIDRTGVFSNGTDRAATYFRSGDIQGYVLINDTIVGAAGSIERSAIFASGVRGPEVAIALKPA